MDYSSISFEGVWEPNSAKARENSSKATWHALFFLFTGSCLLISILRTINTNPGNIPDYKEWDMSSSAGGATTTDTENNSEQQPNE